MWGFCKTPFKKTAAHLEERNWDCLKKSSYVNLPSISGGLPAWVIWHSRRPAQMESSQEQTRWLSEQIKMYGVLYCRLVLLRNTFYNFFINARLIYKNIIILWLHFWSPKSKFKTFCKWSKLQKPKSTFPLFLVRSFPHLRVQNLTLSRLQVKSENTIILFRLISQF